MKTKILLFLTALTFCFAVFSQTLYVPGGLATGIGTSTVSGSVGIGTTNPRAFLDNSNLNYNSLKSVLARLPEGDATGEGTYLGVKSYNTQPGYVTSFAIEHKFYGQLNSSINFCRGGDAYDGFLTFSTNNSERMRINASGVNVNGGITTGSLTATSSLYIPSTGSSYFWNGGTDGNDNVRLSVWDKFTFYNPTGAGLNINNSNWNIQIGARDGSITARGAISAGSIATGAITSSNINSTGDCTIQGNTNGGNPGVIKLWGGQLSGTYTIGGDVTITAGTGALTNGKITLNAPASGNGGGQIYLNGTTNVTGDLTTTGTLSAGSFGTITTSNIKSTGVCTIQGTAVGNTTSGVIKVGSPYLISGTLYNGGDITIQAGTGFKNGTISLNAPDNTNGGGKIYLNGTTSIGTTTARSGCMLTVNGKIAAEEFEIVSDVNGADYVFEPGYKLMGLKELETYINTHHHLPQVKSAIEFKEKGYKVAEMNNLLLQKVEEQSLYIIELNKQMQELREEVKAMRK